MANIAASFYPSYHWSRHWRHRLGPV